MVVAAYERRLFRDLPVADLLIGEEEQAAADRVLATGMLAQGSEVAALETEFAAALDHGRGCVAVNSDVGGLYLGLLASGVRPGDEVIVSSFGSPGPAHAVARTGATPVFADIDRATYCLDPASVATAISPRTVGILLVHQYGHPAAVDALDAIAYRYDLQVFEEVTQAYGASLDGRPLGTTGSFATFSVHPAKTQVLREGSLVSMAAPDAQRRLRRYRNLGVARPREHEILGFEHRMTDLHAAIERVLLTKVRRWTGRRRSNAAYLTAHLRGLAAPTVMMGATHVYHQYVVRVPDDRDGFAKALRDEHGIECGLPQIPAHRMVPGQCLAFLPATEQAARECLSLPVHPALSPDDLDYVVSAVETVAAAGS